MGLNDVLVKSMNQTQLNELSSYNYWDMFISYITKIEGFINLNKNDKNLLNKVVAYIIEILAASSLFIFIMCIFCVLSNKNMYSNHSTTQNITIIMSFIILPLVVILLNKKKELNFISIFKIAIILIIVTREVIVTTVIREIISIFVFWTLLAGSLYSIISNFFIKPNDINAFVIMAIGIFSLSMIYFLKTELQCDELNKIVIKGLFTIINFIITILLATIDFNKYYPINDLLVAKFISLALLFIFQMANIVNMFKELYIFILNGIEKLTTEYITKQDIMSEDEKNKFRNILSSLYIFAPKYNIQTFTFYMKKVINDINYLKIILKNKKKRKKFIILSIITILVIYFYLSILIKYNQFY